MPELPEVERVKRTLEPTLLGGRVVDVHLRRRDIVHRGGAKLPRRIDPAELLAGTTIARLLRHGKNLAIVGDNGRTLCVHLGMSGRLRFLGDGEHEKDLKHVHCVWRLQAGRRPVRLIFQDPRRFGGLWVYESLDAFHCDRLEQLGPDALNISAAQLFALLRRTKRSIKAALLDQSVLAGVGNIYADESLFRAAIDPNSRACAVPQSSVSRLARDIRAVLREAIASGGSTINDYVDANDQPGDYASQHRVYGRGGQPCTECGRTLRSKAIAQRTTVFCSACQTLFR